MYPFKGWTIEGSIYSMGWFSNWRTGMEMLVQRIKDWYIFCSVHIYLPPLRVQIVYKYLFLYFVSISLDPCWESQNFLPSASLHFLSISNVVSDFFSFLLVCNFGSLTFLSSHPFWFAVITFTFQWIHLLHPELADWFQLSNNSLTVSSSWALGIQSDVNVLGDVGR